MGRDRDDVYRAARDLLLRSEDVERKADLAAAVYEADVAHDDAAQQLFAAYQAALEGGWSRAELGALGFHPPRSPQDEQAPPTRIVRRGAGVPKT